MRFSKMSRGIIAASIILFALVFGIPSLQAASESHPDTFTINGTTVTVERDVVVAGEVAYEGQVEADLYTETFSVVSTEIDGVTQTSASLDFVGKDFQINEVSIKNESVAGSTIYDLTTYTNRTGSYTIETEATTAPDGVISGTMTEDMYEPVGEYSFTLTPVDGGASYKLLLTQPDGEVIDPLFYQYVDAWHGPWYAPYELKGWILSWTSSEYITVSVVTLFLGLISGGAFIAAIAIVVTLSAIYTATNGTTYSYWDIILLYGVVNIYLEVGFYTNQVWGQPLGQWWYYAVWPNQWLRHTSVWPIGF